MSITRYEDEVYGPSSYDFEKNESGSWVKYEDHAAEVARLNEHVQALSAENSILDFIISAVKEVARDSEGVTGWHLNGDVATWDEVLPELDHSETLATDAAIREIGAKAIEGFADDWQGEDSHSAISEMARGYANKLRAGEEQPSET